MIFGWHLVAIQLLRTHLILNEWICFCIIIFFSFYKSGNVWTADKSELQLNVVFVLSLDLIDIFFLRKSLETKPILFFCSVLKKRLKSKVRFSLFFSFLFQDEYNLNPGLEWEDEFQGKISKPSTINEYMPTCIFGKWGTKSISRSRFHFEITAYRQSTDIIDCCMNECCVNVFISFLIRFSFYYFFRWFMKKNSKLTNRFTFV